MKNTKKTIMTAVLASLLIVNVAPMLMSKTEAAGTNAQYNYYSDGTWWRIQTDLITILFPANGKKPMFLWWYSNDTNNIFVVKYKGLIEYMTLDYPYYMQKYEANALTIRERLQAKYAMYGPHQARIRERIWAYIGDALDLHPAYLPFSACQWNLTGPANVTRPDGVSYVAFNFTLVKAPLKFKFAENNVIIRCRFYAQEAVENVYGLYNYTVKAGELKMDLVVKNWQWNIDKLNHLFDVLQEEFNITAPKMQAGLALWTDMASINIEDMPKANSDANTTQQSAPESSAEETDEPIEASSSTMDIIAEGQRIQIRNKVATETQQLSIRARLHERFRLRFAKGSQTLAGFFDFVNTAILIDPATEEKTVVNVTAAYIPRGNHMRLFIGYPYFGNKTLEHDPSIGAETVQAWLPPYLLLMLVGATATIAIAIAAVKLRKKTVNVLTVK